VAGEGRRKAAKGWGRAHLSRRASWERREILESSEKKKKKKHVNPRQKRTFKGKKDEGKEAKSLMGLGLVRI